MSDTDQPSIAKQILGAGIGMLIAVALYQGYEIASPVLQAAIAPYFVSEPAVSAAADTDGPLNREKTMEVAQRAQEIFAKQSGAHAAAAR